MKVMLMRLTEVRLKVGRVDRQSSAESSAKKHPPFSSLLLSSKCYYCPCYYFSVMFMNLSFMSTEKPYLTPDQIRTQVIYRNFYQIDSEGAVAYCKARFPLVPQISPGLKGRDHEQKPGVTF